MKIGLVLEGGGMRGLYTAGALDCFLDEKIAVDGIMGVSAGALFGVNYVSKQRGRALRYNKKYINDKRYMGMRSLLKTGNYVNKDFTYYEIPMKLDPFDDQAFERAHLDFYVTLTDVETGEAVYRPIYHVLDQMEELRATSALPYLSKMIEIDGRKYLDGGMADSIPVREMIRRGYEKSIVILTRPQGYRKHKTKELYAKAYYHRYPELAKAINTRFERYNDTMDCIEELESAGKIFVLQPSQLIKVKRLENNPDTLQEIYDLGMKDAQENMEQLHKFLKR